MSEENVIDPKFEGAVAPEPNVAPSNVIHTPEKKSPSVSTASLKSNDKPVNTDKQWYVVNTYTGREKQVAESLERRKNNLNFGNSIFRIVVAQYEEDVRDKNGKPTGKKKIKNFYPGYIFVEMIMSDEAWYMVRNTPDVTGFVGSSGGGTKPFPVPREEIEPVLKRMKIADEDMFTAYKVGDVVKVLTGTWEGSEGKVTSVDQANKEVTLDIMFFGRQNSITAKFSEIEKD